MQTLGMIYVAMIPVLGLFLTIGGYVLQRDRYWRRIWKELGEPQVSSVEELKKLIKRQSLPDSDGTQTKLVSNLKNV